MLVTMVFQTLYFLVDLYWVGRLGKEAVAAGLPLLRSELRERLRFADAVGSADAAGVTRAAEPA